MIVIMGMGVSVQLPFGDDDAAPLEISQFYLDVFDLSQGGPDGRQKKVPQVLLQVCRVGNGPIYGAPGTETKMKLYEVEMTDKIIAPK